MTQEQFLDLRTVRLIKSIKENGFKANLYHGFDFHYSKNNYVGISIKLDSVHTSQIEMLSYICSAAGFDCRIVVVKESITVKSRTGQDTRVEFDIRSRPHRIENIDRQFFDRFNHLVNN